tara:strand:- start:8651 stop:8932 length:282 start_codon:yes stop_codon:yes gene_type:complete
MPLCYYCEEQQRPYFGYYCNDCSMLRRLLLINSPQKCIDILKRTLTRDNKQIGFKINQEIKKILNKEIEEKGQEQEEINKTDSSYMTRSKIKK